MENNYKQDLGRWFEHFKKIQTPIVDEKRNAGELYKDYINSLASFPQWLTIFSGVAGILGIFNKIFLSFSFVAFLLSSLVLLYVKRSVSKKVLDYIGRLDSILKETSSFSSKMVGFANGNIPGEEMKEEKKSFLTNLEKKRNSLYCEDTKREDDLVEGSFWLSTVGGLFLILSLFFELLI